jgi:DNA-binding GntR family transcriptional regulator
MGVRLMRSIDEAPHVKPQSGRRDSSLAVDQSYHAIRDLILQQKLRPGERTSVVALSERLGFGRTPIKEAITRLASEGLLVVSDRRGTYVKEAAPKQIRDLFAVRRLIESYGARESVTLITDEDIAAIGAVLGEMAAESLDESNRRRSLSRFTTLDATLHRSILAGAQNHALTRLYDSMNFELQIAAYLQRNTPEMAEQRHEEHRDIVSALERRDGEALAAALVRHADNVEAVVLSAMESW